MRCVIEPPHEADNENKLAKFISVLEDEKDLPPIVIFPTGRAITGSHRIEAYKTVSKPLPIVMIPENEAMILKDKFLSYEHDKGPTFDICNQLIEITNSGTLKKVLFNQHLKIKVPEDQIPYLKEYWMEAYGY